MKRTPLKRTPFNKKSVKPLKKTSLRPRSIKKKKQMAQEKIDLEKMWKMFLEIWEEREHVCFETKEYLGSEPSTIYMHHVLPKEKYDEYKYCKWNIVLLQWQIHASCENSMDNTPKVKRFHQFLLRNITKLKDRGVEEKMIPSVMEELVRMYKAANGL